MKKYLLLLGIFLLSSSTWANQKVAGFVYDAASKTEPMIGVTVSYIVKGETKGTVTDFDGHYELDVPEGNLILTFSYMGYETQTFPLIVENRKNLEHNVFMDVQSSQLDAVVVSAGRFEQKLSDLTVSMSVLKAADVTKNSPSDIRSTLNNLSGVDVVDKQPSIRGGSGWTYGVGSRCMIMVDGMSILSPVGGEINWNAIPMENIAQMEVMKGASSVLYGSSALNGLINIRTARPSIEPETRVNLYMSIYGKPKNEDYTWWSRDFWKDGRYEVEPFLRKSIFSGIRNPLNNGIDLSHSRRIGNFDVTAALNLFNDEGYKMGGYNKRVRAGGTMMYYSPKYKGLSAGFNVNLLSSDAADVFLWRSDKEPYKQSPLSNMSRQSNEFYFDPSFTYNNRDNNTSHKIKARFYTSTSNIQTKTTSKSLTNILENMGCNYEAVAKDVKELLPLIESISNLDFEALSEGKIDVNAIMPVLSRLQQVSPDLYNMVQPIMGKIENGSTTTEMANVAVDYLVANQLNGLMNFLTSMGDKYFPNATSADYVDLIAWVMGQDIPTDINGAANYLLNAILNNGEKELEPVKEVDRNNAYYVDYQFSKSFESDNVLTAGATYEHVSSESVNSGDHASDNAAIYIQYDDKFFDRLNLSVGARFEYYRVDSLLKESETDIFGIKIPVKPVIRGGLNYQAAKATYIRASYGQGYRYPSITEKFIRKDIGGIGAYPNIDLKPESGYNVELGIKQGFKFGPVQGFLDVAGFYTEYDDMIEFEIGLFNNTTYQPIKNLRNVITAFMDGESLGIGARFYNVDKARIYGAEANLSGICTFNPESDLTFNIGYVYTEPIDVNYKKQNEIEDAYTDPLQMKQKSNASKYLKYRQKHSFKASLDLRWRRFSVGTNLIWKSKTLAVDYFMIDEREKVNPDVMDYVRQMLFGDLHNYWDNKNKGYFTMDLRASVQITPKIKLHGIISNLLNEEFSIRPMDVSQPRTYTLQADIRF